MSQIRNLTVYTYISDGAGGYLEDGNGNLLRGSDIIYQYDMSYARIAGTRLKRRTGIKSARIWPQEENSGKYALTLNRKTLVGLYPSIEAALGVLFGCYIYNYGRGSTFETWFNTLYFQGKIELPVVAPNTLRLERDVNDYVATLFKYDSQTILPANGTHYVALQYSDTSGNFVNSGNATALSSFKDIDADAVINGDDREYTFLNGYPGQPEDTKARVIVIDMDGSLNWVITNVVGAPEILKDEIKTLLSVGFNPSADATLSGETPRTFTAFHTGTAVDVVYTWTIGGDTTNVTSATSGATGQTYTLTWDEVTGSDEVVEVSVSATSANAGVTVNSSVTDITLDQPEPPANLNFEIHISPSNPADGPAPQGDVSMGANAFAVVTDNSTPANTATFDHEWYMELQQISNLTITNNGQGGS